MKKLVQNGYSMIELMVVIFIFIVIFTATMANFRHGERTEELRLAADHVASVIRQAQSQALAGIGEETDLSTDYGLLFIEEINQFLIYKDNNKNKIYDIVGNELIETITLPQTITITEVTGGILNIVFSPPRPTIYINGDTVLQEAEIKLNHLKISDKQGTINFNRITGRVNSEITSLP